MKLQTITINFKNGYKIFSGSMIPVNIEKVKQFYNTFYDGCTYEVKNVKR